jgi:multidrug resistance efflux pump
MSPASARNIPLLILLPLLSACDPNGNGATVSGQIEGRAIHAGSRVGGRVIEAPVREGDRVESGTVLLRLDAAEAEATVAAARANLARLDAALQKVINGATPEQLQQAEAAKAAADARYQLALSGARSEEIKAAAAAADAARAQRDNATREHARLKKLLAEAAIAQQQYDQAASLAEAAEANWRAAHERYAALLSGAREEELAIAKADADRATALLEELRKGAREEDIAAARAARDAAAADLARAESLLAEMVVTAPTAGVVESMDLRPGDIVRPGPLLRLVDPDDLEVTIYVSALYLGQLRLGDEIRLTSDAHGSETFTAHITYIAQQGEFTPRNLQTKEERVQQVFAVKLRLDSHGGKLHAGMTVAAHLPRLQH